MPLPVAVAEYLTRVRGAQAEPADLVVTSGATDGMGLLCRMLRMHGHTRVAVEDPSWHRLRDVLTASGLAAVPVPVDDEGLRVEPLGAHRGVRAVIVSPAHQFPVSPSAWCFRRGAARRCSTGPGPRTG